MPTAALMLAPALLIDAPADLRSVTDTVRGLLPTPRWCKRRVLNNNQLTGVIPDSLGSLSGLVILCVPACAVAVMRACESAGRHVSSQ
jgi:hypothetical protein